MARAPACRVDVRAVAGSAALALGGAFAWAGCHDRAPIAWLGAVSLVPLLLLLERSRGGLWGWLHGTVSWLAAIPWIVPTLVRFGGLPTALSWVLLTLLAAYLGAYHGLFVRLGRPLWERGGPFVFVGLPALWVALETARGWLFGGFPWNLAGYAWENAPGALPLSAWTGTEGVTALVLLVNLGVARSLARRRWEPATAAALVALSILAAAGRWSAPPPGERPAGEVRIVQPNTGILDPARDDLEAVYRRVIAMAQAECEGVPSVAPQGAPSSTGSRLLVLPESALWPFSWEETPALRRDLARLADAGCPVIVNGVARRGALIFNSAYLVDRGGAVTRYDKRRLVPYGEYVPLGGIVPFVERLARNAGAFTAGSEAVLLPWGEERLGMAICYEVTYAREAAELVRAGATMLVTVTNDAWYGDSSAPWQHFRAARFRAAESRRPLLRAALTGVSGLVDARGRVVGQLGVGERGTLSARVVGLDGPSPYVRAPWLPPAAAAAIALFAIVSALRPRGLSPWPP